MVDRLQGSVRYAVSWYTCRLFCAVVHAFFIPPSCVVVIDLLTSCPRVCWVCRCDHYLSRADRWQVGLQPHVLPGMLWAVMDFGNHILKPCACVSEATPAVLDWFLSRLFPLVVRLLLCSWSVSRRQLKSWIPQHVVGTVSAGVTLCVQVWAAWGGVLCCVLQACGGIRVLQACCRHPWVCKPSLYSLPDRQ